MRRNLVRLAVAIAAIAAPLVLMVPAAHATGGCDSGDGASGSAQALGSILDGWANRDLDIGIFASAEPPDLLDGWANRDLDISAFGSAMATGIGSRVDGWANPDVDISSFGSAMTAGTGSILDGWGNRDLDISAFGFADRCNS
jgi:hypothetical protein